MAWNSLSHNWIYSISWVGEHLYCYLPLLHFSRHLVNFYLLVICNNKKSKNHGTLLLTCLEIWQCCFFFHRLYRTFPCHYQYNTNLFLIRISILRDLSLSFIDGSCIRPLFHSHLLLFKHETIFFKLYQKHKFHSTSRKQC